MSHIRSVFSPQGGFGGLSPPNWNMKTINVWSFVNFFNVKASTGKQKTHSNHNVGWFSPELTLTIIWGDFHPEITLTITSGDFHLGTAWPPLLPGWKSPEISIPGVWVIVAENLIVFNAGTCSPSLAVSTWTSFCSVLMVNRFHSVVLSQSSCPQWNALAFYRKCPHNKSKPFWFSQSSNLQTSIRNRKAQGLSSSIKCFDLSPQVHTTRCMPFLAPISFLWRWMRHSFPCLFLNENQERSRSNSRQIDLPRQCLHSCDLLPCWLRSKVAGVAY